MLHAICLILRLLFGQIGPNVSISANVRVGAGVRLLDCIILDDVELQVRDLNMLSGKEYLKDEYYAIS